MSLPLTRYKVFTDRSRCCGYGLCAATCPDIYKLDGDGIVYLATDQVPAELVEEAREGAAAIWLEPIEPHQVSR